MYSTKFPVGGTRLDTKVDRRALRELLLRVLLKTRLLARWLSSRPVDSHFLKKIVLFFRCCFMNCSLEQAL